MDLQNKKILVTGGAGFLGRHVVARLQQEDCQKILIPRSRDYDLTVQQDVWRLFDEFCPDVVVHLAGVVAGIGGNRRFPGTIAYKNLVMGANLIEMSRRAGVEKILLTGTICSYPKYTRVPFQESNLWSGFPEETNAPYGLAKKMLMVQLQAYQQEFGLRGINLLIVNLYGPGDNFDLQSSHVIPALIRKCIEAKEQGKKHIEVWGSGRATREFLFVKDAAQAICTALTNLETAEPVNVGSGIEISIADLVKLIAAKTGFHGEIRFDLNKPDGQPRRCLDTSRAQQLFGFQAKTNFEEGLEKTISWYRKERSNLEQSGFAGYVWEDWEESKMKSEEMGSEEVSEEMGSEEVSEEMGVRR